MGKHSVSDDGLVIHNPFSTKSTDNSRSSRVTSFDDDAWTDFGSSNEEFDIASTNEIEVLDSDSLNRINSARRFGNYPQSVDAEFSVISDSNSPSSGNEFWDQSSHSPDPAFERASDYGYFDSSRRDFDSPKPVHNPFSQPAQPEPQPTRQASQFAAPTLVDDLPAPPERKSARKQASEGIVLDPNEDFYVEPRETLLKRTIMWTVILSLAVSGIIFIISGTTDLSQLPPLPGG